MEHEPIIGIDLGTTNSVVAVVQEGQARVIEEEGAAILPSVVGFDEQGQLLVGVPARNQFVLAPERTVRSIKRKMGQDVEVPLGDRKYTPQEVSAIILRRLKQRAEQHLGREVRKAVITVPAFFSEMQREATRHAGELAGLEVVRIINEPTAASLAYDPHPTDMERLLVYDLGGGTFDVSVVQIEQGVVEVLASHGDTHLGGDDFDQLLLDHVCDAFAAEHGLDLRQSPRSRSRLLYAVEEAKKALSDEAVVPLAEEFIAEKDGLPLHLNRELTRLEYEGLIEPLLAKTLECVDKALTDAGIQASQIDRVVLVGGASRTPLVHELLQERLGQPVHTEVDPDLCVAVGAAVQGALIAGLDVGPVLVDITPHTLGIRAFGRLHGLPTDQVFAAIIERNSPLPANRSEMFSTMVDRQESAIIEIYQGEDDNVQHNEYVGEFLLEGLAEVERGNEILVRFVLDLDGILQVIATERATGLEKRLTIDNAVERFRCRTRLDEHQRLQDVFDAMEGPPREEFARLGASLGSDPGHAGDPGHAAEADESLPPELHEALAEARELLARGDGLLESSNEEDAAELRDLLQRVRTAVERRSLTDIREGLAELEDLVFYLQDA